MDKVFKLPISSDDEKYKFLIKFLGLFVDEYKDLSRREIEVLAELYILHNKYINVPEEDKGKLIFHVDNKKLIAEKLGITLFNFHNIVGSLTEKGFRDESGLPRVIPMMDKVTFIFKNE